jgi:DNA-directed RNA polymerase sigma subunit (sigma70/sigma32)
MPDNCNCVLIASDEKHTLQEVGNIYGVTRMRICQIEKRALKKLGEFATYLVQ